MAHTFLLIFLVSHERRGMIPLKLQLKNFLSYGPVPQTIDFGNHHLICLSGKNGHGKSALLDALTWAIWGQARKIGGAVKPDQGLLRLGQTQMLVCLDFIFNGTHYRVKREFAQTYGKATASLEFGIVDETAQTLTPLTGKTIRETQEQIDRLLALDFDGFVNSSFLRQGHANEFSKKSPRDRKNILGRILGLDKFDAVRTLALERHRHATEQRGQREKIVERITSELGKKDEIALLITHLEEQLATLRAQEDTLKQRSVAHTHHTKLLQERQQVALVHETALKNQREQEQAQCQTLSVLAAQWRTAHHQQLHAPDPAVFERQRVELQGRLTALQEKAGQQLTLQEALLKCTAQEQAHAHTISTDHTRAVHEARLNVERAQFRLTTAMQQQKHSAEQLMRLTTEQTTRERELKQLTTTLHQHDLHLKEYDSVRARFERRKEFYQKFRTMGTVAHQELTALNQRKEMCADADNPSCPLCEQALTLARKRFLQQKTEKQRVALAHRVDRLTRVVKDLKEILVADHAHLTQLDEEQKRRALAQERITSLTDSHATERLVQDGLNNENARLAAESAAATQEHHALMQRLQMLELPSTHPLLTDERYRTLQAEKRLCEQQIQALAYQPQEHAAVQKELTTLEQSLAISANRTVHADRQQERRHEIRRLIQQIRELRSTQKQLLQAIAQLGNLTEQERELRLQAGELATAQEALQRQKEELMQTQGRLHNERLKLTQLEQELLQEQKLMEQLAQEAYEYQTIAQAMGKEGIQALLIENVLPEIEQEANALLSRLTDNQAHIMFESLRDLKKGGTRETLDIKISDGMGIRPYELFSGGEAFRIDFALRIAISKLLARRAGTSLQTLIIDEGFGSQDDDGLQNLMEALYKIQHDFAKIIIVSHLPFMKQQFPAHLHVVKGPQGSIAQIIEQG